MFYSQKYYWLFASKSKLKKKKIEYPQNNLLLLACLDIKECDIITIKSRSFYNRTFYKAMIMELTVKYQQSTECLSSQHEHV